MNPKQTNQLNTQITTGDADVDTEEEVAESNLDRNTLFYDGKCPVCAKEIKLLTRFSDDRLKLVNLHVLSQAEFGALQHSKSEMLEVLHYLSVKGNWHVGLDATVAAWRHTKFGWILLPLRWPIVKSIVDRAYYAWARKRFCALDYN